MTALAPRSPTSDARMPAVRRVLAPLAVALLAAAGVVATYKVFIRTSLGQLVDTAAMRGGDVHHPRVVEVLSRTLNGTTLVSLVLACVAAAAIGVLRKRLDLAIAATVAVLGANASCQLLKTRLERPNLDDFPAPNSFPSGHTAAAASVAFALILVLPQAVRGMVALIGGGYVAIIAVATVWAEWHRPSDTLAAVLLVLAWYAFALFVARLGRRRSPGPDERAGRATTVLLLLVAGVTGAAGVLGLVTVALSERVTPGLVSGRFAFLTGSAGVTAVAACGFLVWLRLTAEPGGAAPRTELPADGAPDHTAGKTTPAKAAAAQGKPGRGTPGKTAPASDRTAPAKSASSKSTSGKSTSSKTASSKTASSKSTSGTTASSKTASSKTASSKTAKAGRPARRPEGGTK